MDPNGTICDLGANFGSHTVYFAAIMKARMVHSFEPQAHLIDVIKKTLDLNQIDKVTLHHAVAGAKSGKAYLKRANAKTQEWRSFDRAWVTGQLMMLLVMSM